MLKVAKVLATVSQTISNANQRPGHFLQFSTLLRFTSVKINETLTAYQSQRQQVDRR
jgi:hypothetical protein